MSTGYSLGAIFVPSGGTLTVYGAPLAVPSDECAIARYFKEHPNATSVSMVCTCGRCCSSFTATSTTTPVIAWYNVLSHVYR